VYDVLAHSWIKYLSGSAVLALLFILVWYNIIIEKEKNNIRGGSYGVNKGKWFFFSPEILSSFCLFGLASLYFNHLKDVKRFIQINIHEGGGEGHVRMQPKDSKTI
jgi:hypothetical protein